MKINNLYPADPDPLYIEFTSIFYGSKELYTTKKVRLKLLIMKSTGKSGRVNLIGKIVR